MAAPVYTFDGVTQTTADSATGFSAGSLDTDSEHQGTGCIGAKTANATNNFNHTGTSRDVTNGWHAYAWLACLTPSLDTKANGGLGINVGTSGVFYVGGDGTASDDPYRGGWKCFVADPQATPDSGSVGTLTTVTVLGGRVKTIAGLMGNFNNGLTDALRFGFGLQVTDGASNPADWAGLLAFDEGTKNNKYGILRSTPAGLIALGKIKLGNGSTTGEFEDDSFTVVWENANVATDFYELLVAAAETATFGVLTGSVISGRWTLASEKSTARVSLTVEGTLNAYGGTMRLFRVLDLNSTTLLRDCTVVDSGLITQNSATITDCLVSASTNAVALLCNNPSLITGSRIISGGSGHAIEFTSAVPSSFTLNADLIGYGGTPGSNTTASSGSTDAAIYNNSGKALTITIPAGFTTPAVRNGSGATTTIVETLTTLEFTGLKNPTEVRVYDAASPTTEIAGQESVTGGTFSTSINPATYPDVIYHLISLGYLIERQTVDMTNGDLSIPIDQSVDRQYENP